MVATSSNGFGSYQRADDPSLVGSLHVSPLYASVRLQVYLQPSGGASMATRDVSQALRSAASHKLFAQTPDVYPNHPTLRVVVRCFDAFGNARVATPSISVQGLMSGKSGQPSFASSVKDRSYVYVATVPASWFSDDDGGTRTASVSASLGGGAPQSVSVSVHARPSWRSARLASAGIAAYVTSDAAGNVPASHFRVGDTFYWQLYAHTGSFGLTTFSVQFEEDVGVCHAVPASGTWSSAYEGDVIAKTDGAYSLELARRYPPSGSALGHYVKYQRLSKNGAALTSVYGHLGYVRMKVVGSGSCLVSADIRAFNHGTQTIPGGELYTPVTLHGNTLALISDGPVALVGEVVESMPLLNAAQYTGSAVSASITGIVLSSPDGQRTFSDSLAIGADLGSDTTKSISYSALADTVAVSVRRLDAPTVVVEDNRLERVQGANVFQRSRVSAHVGGLDVTHMASFGVSNSGVLSVETSGPYPRIGGVSAGSALVYVGEVAFASRQVSVVDEFVSVSSLRAFVVSSVEWSTAEWQGVSGSFVPVARQLLASEGARAWVYQQASFSDGTSEWVDVALSVSAAAPLNTSVGPTTTTPPRVEVLFGATSVCGQLAVSSFLGTAYATVNVTMPPPTSLALSVSAGGSNKLCPSGNGAEEFDNPLDAHKRQDTRRKLGSSTGLVARVSFADGTARNMQADARVTFTVPDGCGSVSGDGTLLIASTCRQASVTVLATASIGSYSVVGSVSVDVIWLSSVRLQLLYRDGSTPYTRPSLYLHYAAGCNGASAAAFHRLVVRTYGSLSSGGSELALSRVSYTTFGASATVAFGNVAGAYWLDVTSAGAVSVSTQPQPNPSTPVSHDTRILMANAAADAYTFSWDARLASQSTLSAVYAAQHWTHATLQYADYTEVLSDGEKETLVTFGSSDSATISVSASGRLQAMQNSEAPLDLSADFCDGQSVLKSGVSANLQPGNPFDYDLGSVHGLAIVYTPGVSPQVCIPIRLYSERVVDEFQFTLYFTQTMLDCTSLSCGSFVAGADW